MVGHAPKGDEACLAGGSAHAVQNIFMRDDLGARGGVGQVAGHIRAGDGHARAPHGVVAAGVIGMHVGIDDVLDGLVGKLANRGDQLVGVLREAGVDHHHAHIADLHGDVSARALQHINVALHVHGSDLGIRRRRLLGFDRDCDRENGRGCQKCFLHEFSKVIFSRQRLFSFA